MTMLKVGGIAMLVLLGGVLIASGQELPAYRDGTYQGKHSFVAVSVTIAQGRISEIQITQHEGGGEQYAQMVQPLLVQMLEKQSTQVDTVTGATVSSNYLKKAVAAALLQAQVK